MSSKDGLGYRLLFCGPAGGGKTTIIERITNEFDITAFDVRELVVELLRRTGKLELIGDELKPLYVELIQQLPTTQHDVLEIAPDWPEIYLEGIINAFFKGEKGRIIYVDVSFESSVERTKTRKYPTPVSTIQRQHGYSFEYYRREAEEREIFIVRVDGDGKIDEEYKRLQDFLKQGEN